MPGNRTFNVNGPISRRKLFDAALQLGFDQAVYSDDTEHHAIGYSISGEYGFILYQYKVENMIPLPTAMTASQISDMIWAWLNSPETWEKGNFAMEGIDADEDHDGHNTKGWRMYCERWGYVGGQYQAFMAIRPSYQWYEK